MITEQKKQTIKLGVAVFILVIILVLVAIAMIKYQVEGEKNMPFELSKIVVISTAEGEENTEEKESKNKWNFNIYQNNDVYLYIDQNENNKKEDVLLKQVTLENFQITKQPSKGNIKIYMPNSKKGRLYSFEENYIVTERLRYTGASQSEPKNLEIGSKGGSALFRFSNTQIGKYTSDKDKQITHDGTLLKKINVNYEELQFEASFDMIIETTKNKYKSTISLQMPTGNIIEEKTSNLEKTDMSDIIFKRIK